VSERKKAVALALSALAWSIVLSPAWLAMFGWTFVWSAPLVFWFPIACAIVGVLGAHRLHFMTLLFSSLALSVFCVLAVWVGGWLYAPAAAVLGWAASVAGRNGGLSSQEHTEP
jgi:hypothetical protein